MNVAEKRALLFTSGPQVAAVNLKLSTTHKSESPTRIRIGKLFTYICMPILLSLYYLYLNERCSAAACGRGPYSNTKIVTGWSRAREFLTAPHGLPTLGQNQLKGTSRHRSAPSYS